MPRLVRLRFYLNSIAGLAALGTLVWIIPVRPGWFGDAASLGSTILPALGLGVLLMVEWLSAALVRSLRRINATLAHGYAEQPGRIDERDLPALLLPLVRAYNSLGDSLEEQRRAAHEQSRRVALLARLAVELRADLDPPAVSALVLRAIAAGADVERAGIILIGPDGAIDHAVAYAGGKLAHLAPAQAARALERGLAGLALRQGRPVLLADAARDKRWAPAGDERPCGSAITIPLNNGHTPFGVLTVTHPAPGHFAEQDLPLFEGIAAYTGMALDTARYRAEEQSHRTQALSLFAMSQAAAAERSPADLAADLLDKSATLIDAQRMALFLPDAGSGALALVAARGRQDDDAEPAATLAATAARAWRDRATVTEVLPAANVGQPDASGRDEPNLAYVALPLLHNGALTGVFALVCRAHGAAVFSARVWSMLTILTNVAAAAFANRQMIEQLRRRTELLQEEVRERTSQLRHSRDLLRVVFDHLPDGLVLLDAEAQVLTANDAFCREVLGLPPQAVVGRHYPALAEDLEGRGQLAFEPRPTDPAARRVRRSGPADEQRWYEIDRYAVRSDDEAQVIERWRDVTRQEELQRQLLLHEQLASLGRLAASVVHEVGNPLQSVRSCLELCREGGALPAPAAEYLELANGELSRMAHILAQLRDLYRPPRQVWERVDPHQVIRTVQRITAAQLRRDRIKLELALAPDLTPVNAQAGALHQVLVNLVLNAAAAMPDGGTIAITTLPDAGRRMSGFSVADTGVGIGPSQLSRLFEPFATGTVQGLGLGLYLSHQIIQQHGGTIDVTSTVNVGTTVTVYLPWSEANDDT